MTCYHQFEFIHTYSGKQCVYCQKKLKKDEIRLKCCQDCQYWKAHVHLPIITNRALLYYNSFAHNLMERLKFQGDIQLWDSMCAMMKMFHLFNTRLPIQCIPSSEETYKRRDFNHLHYIGNELKLQMVECIKKKEHIPSQVRLNDVHERRRLKEGFEWEEGDKVSSVVLFDDVYTTGSTLKDCQMLFSENNVKVIQTITVFRSDLR